MPKTNSELVKKYLGQDYDSLEKPDLDPYIDLAALNVADVIVCAAGKTPAITFSAAKLEMLERLLACHHYKGPDPQLASKSTSGGSGSFRGVFGKGLESTSYGQAALQLDTSGCLRVIDAGRVARGAWLGRPPSEQTPYFERD